MADFFSIVPNQYKTQGGEEFLLISVRSWASPFKRIEIEPAEKALGEAKIDVGIYWWVLEKSCRHEVEDSSPAIFERN